MRKILIYGAGVIIIGLVIYSISGDADKRFLKRYVKELEAAQVKAQERADSVEAAFKSTRDSLDIAFHTIRIVAAEREEAKQDRIKLIKGYEKIQFVAFKTDSARYSALMSLYPSIKKPVE